ncbi:probable prolyl 4-hydroxylase 3 [Dioscorea cayenensis subsp. rotundata]|uniref:procollagen-proline 4-dioxygenase n=1 Tax=Dioscorea cayennensis subsp. rotundata TaxID=55577 RepID=A0AB40CSA1_DIOCR|nr:probable prolyl 4-hydroxylase 3 [Dioscorea cayenensis subsp. rotundata]
MAKASWRSSDRWLWCILVSAVLLTLLMTFFLLFAFNFDQDDVSELIHNEKVDGIGERGEQWMEVISWEPRIFIYRNLLSNEECEYLIKLSLPRMQQSTVIDKNTGGNISSRQRTSSGMFLKRGHDSIIQAIEKRIADFTFMPIEHGEGLQILHYEVGQKYDPHYDHFHNADRIADRIATVLMYLSDVEEGGETVFPLAKNTMNSVSRSSNLSECGKMGLSVKPKKGDALLFWSLKPDGSLDTTSLHGGCPVLKGYKWSSTKWLRVNKYYHL